MPTKRGAPPVQVEDQVKGIARRLSARRTQRSASGSRDAQDTAVTLIQLLQRMDRLAMQRELERLDP